MRFLRIRRSPRAHPRRKKTQWDGQAFFFSVARVEAAPGAATLTPDILSMTAHLDRSSGEMVALTLPRLACRRESSRCGVRRSIKAPDSEQRRDWRVPDDRSADRRVKLMWRVARAVEEGTSGMHRRLTPEMNKLWTRRDSPFGVVVRGVHFQRHPCRRTLLASAARGLEMNAARRARLGCG